MVRGIPVEATDADLKNEVTRYGLEPKDIRLMKRRDTGNASFQAAYLSCLSLHTVPCDVFLGLSGHRAA